MNKQEILKKYPKEEDKLLISKVLDKIQFTKTKNQVQFTDFLDGYQQKIIKQLLEQIREIPFVFSGGYQDSERKMLFLFPQKLQELIENLDNQNSVVEETIKVIEVTLPNDLKGSYQHRDYLSAFMKLGMKREKMGDILVREDGADIIVQVDIASYLADHLAELTRFQKSNILLKSISKLIIVQVQKELMTILVSQLRLDSVISELLHLSRTKTNEIILQDRVFVNYELKNKNATLLKENDIVTIRGKGKFQIGNIISETAKGKIRLQVEKYCS